MSAILSSDWTSGTTYGGPLQTMEGWRVLSDQSSSDHGANQSRSSEAEVPPDEVRDEGPTPAQNASPSGTKRGRVSSAVALGLGLYTSYRRRNGPLLSAGIAYYVLFALGPLAWITLQAAGRLLRDASLSSTDRLVSALEPYLGTEMASMLAGLVADVRDPASYTFGIVGVVILLYGATRLFFRLQGSFNIMWDIRVVSEKVSRARALDRLAVFGLMLVPTLLLVFGSVLGAGFGWLAELMHVSGSLSVIPRALVPLVLTWLALLAEFVVLPDIHLSWRDCWSSALVVAVAWRVGTYVFGLYLSWTGGAKYAGSIGAFLGLILWVDVMAILTLLGVRLNKAIYLWRGKTIRPYNYAAPIAELPDAAPPFLRRSAR